MSPGLVRFASMTLILMPCLGRGILDPSLTSLVLHQNEAMGTTIAAFPRATAGPKISSTYVTPVENYSRTVTISGLRASSTAPTVAENWTEYCKDSTIPLRNIISAGCDLRECPVMLSRMDKIWQRDIEATGAPKSPASDPTAIPSTTRRPKSKPVQLSRAESLYKIRKPTTHAKGDAVIAQPSCWTTVTGGSFSDTIGSFPTLNAIPRAFILALENQIWKAAPTPNGRTDYVLPTTSPDPGRVQVQSPEVHQTVSGLWRLRAEHQGSYISSREMTPLLQNLHHENDDRLDTNRFSSSRSGHSNIAVVDFVAHHPMARLLCREDASATEVDNATPLKDEVEAKELQHRNNGDDHTEKTTRTKNLHNALTISQQAEILRKRDEEKDMSTRRKEREHKLCRRSISSSFGSIEWAKDEVKDE